MDRKHKKTAWVTAGMMLMASLPAFAAGLGKLTVTSTLGQPFRGEIELLAVDKKDLDSLRAAFAPREAFKDANIERSPALAGMRFSVEKKKSGEPYLKITSSKPIEEPFLDMLIELDWPSGRLVREYTVLLDPPGYGETQAAAPVSVPTGKAAPVAAKAEDMKLAEMPAAVQPETRANAPLEQKQPAKGARKTAAEGTAGGEEYGPVKKGQNLAGIAAEVKPEGISLEQMLVALFQTNKQAFVGNNMNRLKAGQILRLPEADKIGEIEQKTAAKEVRAQAADWHAYRQKLAAAVAEAKPAQEETKQAASGKITTAVEDKAAAAKEPAKDVLKLSKSEALSAAKAGTAAPGAAGAAGGKEMQGMKDQLHAMQEEATAKDKAIKEANQRISDLEKNIKEMQKLLELKNQNLADLQQQAAAAKTAPATAPAPVPAPAAAAPAKPEEKPAAAPAEPKAEAAKPAAPAAGEKPAAKPKKPVVVEAPKSESSLLDDLLENPLYLGGGVLALLLIGLLGAKGLAARRKKSIASFEDSIMTNGDLKANTVLGGTSGGKIDTSDTSFLTDFSQAGLGAIDTNEVDPIAEAEVYMAYGRDAQAEEILKEAMVKDPARQEIRLKLLEIYAGRKNLNAFEAVAGEMYATLGGKGSPVWDKAAELGRSLDPQNPLYGEQPKGAPAAAPAAASENMFEKTMIVAGGAAGVVAAAEHGVTLDLGAPQEVESAAPDLDFNLDLGTPTVAEQPAEAPAAPTAEAAPAEEAVTDLGFDFDLGALTGTPAEASAAAAPIEEKAEEPAETALDFNLDLDAISAPAAKPAEEAKVEAAPEEGLMEFDLGALTQPAPAPAQEAQISAESWQDEVMGLDLEAAPAAPMEAAAAPAPELEIPDFAAVAPVAAEPESIELAAPPAEEAHLDFDFDLGQEEQVSAAPAPAAESAPDLDLSGISLDMGGAAPAAAPAAGPVDFGSQEVSTKLDLARAYVDMGDMEGAREILQEVIREGGTEQQEEAKKLLSELG